MKPRKPKRVDPISGAPSTASNAIPYGTYYLRVKVDPVTGVPSSAANAITRGTFYDHQMVDPITGVSSNAPDAITYRSYKYQKNLIKLKPNATNSSNTQTTIANTDTSVIAKRHKRSPVPVEQHQNVVTTTTEAAVVETDFFASLVAFDWATSQVDDSCWDKVSDYDPAAHTLFETQASLDSATNRLESAMTDTFDIVATTPAITIAQPSQFGLFAQTQTQLSNNDDQDFNVFPFDDPQFENQLKEYFK